jgi:hypothetical protein
MSLDFKLPEFPNPYEVQSKHFMETVRRVRQTMESKAKPDQIVELSYSNGFEPIFIGSIQVDQKIAMAILTGVDRDGNPTNVMAHVSTIQLVWKLVPKEKLKENHIGFTGVTVDQKEAEQ